ncbi:dihydrolipoamide acetyltransferase [Candidatus Pantoea edessiphila]|uniref:Dihydrolipoamide acetyltransferase component of pyruvate dehydrogenase complex n=1 Tax=Candidatus Pantoea edessiphila TaxID=2044610 RepID=A0A2P5T092_9GAMM|nr:2-oxo acid dehydrogenase subunit E2 [Candidatus Pantoea edessiphila]PPI87983.1 dihydrolipoamide acetyltransferase [Candidatus Pantoea edessiphila]
MNIEVNVPDIGEGEFEVTEILVNVGDTVEIEQSLITVEGNKVSIEIPSPYKGVIENINVHNGAKIKIGSLIMTLKIIEEKKILNHINKNKKQLLSVDLEEIENKKKVENDTVKNNFVKEIYIHATPVVRRLAYKFGINLVHIKGKGRKNRIMKECVDNYIKEAIKFFESSSDVINKFKDIHHIYDKKNISNINHFDKIEEIKLSSIQKISGSNLSHNWITIPHVTHFDKVDITNLEEFRNRQNIEIKKKDPSTKLNLLAFIMKAVNYALNQMPRFNSSLSSDLQKVILKKYINIGIAVDTPKGLVVPVFKNIDKKTILKLSAELINVSKEAIKGKLTADKMQGGTFTISSLGGIGTNYFTPIINAPEVAILGISKCSMEAVWNGKEFLPRLMLPISLSFDHRVIDGADGARFMNLINSILKDIRLLII